MSVASVYRIITNKLKMRKVAARWVPHHLSDEQKACRQRIAEELLQRYQTEGEQFLRRILTIDETWIRDFEPDPLHYPHTPLSKPCEFRLGSFHVKIQF